MKAWCEEPLRTAGFTSNKRGNCMNTKLDGPNISRRGFLAFADAASSVALLAPRQPFAQDDGLLQMARRSASSSNITVQKLRGNISVLMGAGGNIAVLPGRDGKLLIEAGFAGSRLKLTDALASISSDPIKQLINTHWHFDHTDDKEWLHSAAGSISRKAFPRTIRNILCNSFELFG